MPYERGCRRQGSGVWEIMLVMARRFVGCEVW